MKLFNTLTRQKETFRPQEEGKVTLYTCGPTVYDYMHLGNWVAYIRWDVLVRVLQNAGYKVERVMNITDVGHLVSDADEGEDKLESGAKREGMTAWEIAQKYTDDFEKGLHDLNLLPPKFMPKATEHINEQIALIKNLEDKGYTYLISDGVYFDTSKFPKYSEFANLNLSGQQDGARVTPNHEKRNSWDFALWKLTPYGQKRHMQWDSPWGKGFPGWHLECSAMAMKYLGETIDIHTGGIDHIPVHHTNEIAQSEAATNKPLSQYWLHNNFMMVEGVKISKSLGNTIKLSDVVGYGFSLMDFKMMVMQSHYRSESNFTWDSLGGAKERLQNLRGLADLRWQPRETPAGTPVDFDKYLHEIIEALQDDLNTPMALAVISRVIDSISNLSSQDVQNLVSFIDTIDSLLGFDLGSQKDITHEQKRLINEREQARQQNDYRSADKIREELSQQGILINDTAGGPVWSRI